MQKISIRLTSDNLDDIHPGDIIIGAEEMGRIKSVRPTSGFENKQATITTIREDGTRDQDNFAIPLTLTLKRD